jgi:mRNA deadenylase 3'-5' endonuclease subunit Ccr4
MAFTFVTWNVLATAYLRTSFYPHTSVDLFKKSWRIPALAAYAAGLDADLLCLQEVESEVFTALRERLEPLGYQGVHHLKEGKPDGCATFVRAPLCKLLDAHRTVYEDGSGHIAQVVHLEHDGQAYAVLNTHLKWGPQFGYRQMLFAVDLLDRDPAPRQILCGDLNATPEGDVVAGLREAGFDYAHRGMAGVRTCNANRQAKLIDYIFHRGPLKASAVAPAKIGNDTPMPSLELPSDHLPLRAVFTAAAGLAAG